MHIYVSYILFKSLRHANDMCITGPDHFSAVFAEEDDFLALLWLPLLLPLLLLLLLLLLLDDFAALKALELFEVSDPIPLVRGRLGARLGRRDVLGMLLTVGSLEGASETEGFSEGA